MNCLSLKIIIFLFPFYIFSQNEKIIDSLVPKLGADLCASVKKANVAYKKDSTFDRDYFLAQASTDSFIKHQQILSDKKTNTPYQLNEAYLRESFMNYILSNCKEGYFKIYGEKTFDRKEEIQTLVEEEFVEIEGDLDEEEIPDENIRVSITAQIIKIEDLGNDLKIIYVVDEFDGNNQILIRDHFIGEAYIENDKDTTNKWFEIIYQVEHQYNKESNEKESFNVIRELKIK